MTGSAVELSEDTMARLASGEGRRGFFQRSILFHTHIERSAGSSLAAAFADLFGATHLHDLRPVGAAQPRDMACRDKRRVRVLTGHFHYGSMDAWFARRKVYVATVRDPMERFLSRYRYVRMSPSHPAYPAVHGKNPDQLITELIARDHPLAANEMSRSLGIARPHDIASQIDKSYAIIAPFERVGELIAALYRVFGRCKAPVIRLNVGPQEAVALAPEARRLFLSRNQTDTALCAFVERRFDAWLNDLEERLCRPQPGKAADAPAMHRLGQWWNGFIRQRSARTG